MRLVPNFLSTRDGKIYYGWYIAAAAFFGLILSMGSRSAFGPFFLPTASATGLSRTMISAGAMGGIGLMTPASALLIDFRLGAYSVAFVITAFLLVLASLLSIRVRESGSGRPG